MFITSGRKASIGTSVKTIIGIIIAIIVILGTLAVFGDLLGIFTGGPDQETQLMFLKFVEGVEALADPSVPDGSACFIRASMHPDWGIYGFDADRSQHHQTCGGDEEVDKPPGCGGKKATELGCICSCYSGNYGPDDNDCLQDNPECRPVPHFTQFRYPNHNSYDDDDYSWWRFKGDPGVVDVDAFWMSPFQELQIQNYYCGGSVWGKGVQSYLLVKSRRKDSSNKPILYVLRVLEGRSYSQGKVPSVNALKVVYGGGEPQPVPDCHMLYNQIFKKAASGEEGVVRS